MLPLIYLANVLFHFSRLIRSKMIVQSIALCGKDVKYNREAKMQDEMSSYHHDTMTQTL